MLLTGINNYLCLMKNYLFLILMLGLAKCFAQTVFTFPKKPNTSFTFSGYGDMYFGYQSGGENQKVNFLYNHKVNNSIRTNLILFKSELLSKRFRSIIAIMTGDYSKYNLASEPKWARPINEAYIGIKLIKKKNLWMDFGVYSSYIGYESPITTDSPMLTRSLVADNTPYYLSGARILFISANKKHEIGLHLLNGWQRIEWDPNQKFPSFGMQYKHILNENLSLFYGNYFGAVHTNNVDVNRFYQHINAYLSKGKWAWLATLDLGIQEKQEWGGAQFNSRYYFSKKWNTAMRVEAFLDPSNRCIRIGKPEKSILGGLAWSTEYNPSKSIFLRLEPKILCATEPILKNRNTQFQINASLAVKW